MNESLQTFCQVLIFIGLIFTALGGFGYYYFSYQSEQRDKEELHARLDQLLPERKALHLRAVQRLNAIGATVEPTEDSRGYKVVFLRLDVPLEKTVEYLQDIDNLLDLSLNSPVGVVSSSGRKFQPVRNIIPLQQFHSLEKLNLSSTEIEDISPLASLRNLRLLNLGYTRVQDIRPLSSLKHPTDCSNKTTFY